MTDHPLAKAFILHWGEMGTHWGVNRSIAQIHALLYLEDRPVTAEEVADRLHLARSNVSNGLKELQAFTLVKRVHVEGDRRDHFVAETDLWEMTMRIVAERKRREIDATIAALADLTRDLRADRTAPVHIRERIGEMHGFLLRMSNWYEEVCGLKRSKLVALVKLGGRVSRLVPKSLRKAEGKAKQA